MQEIGRVLLTTKSVDFIMPKEAREYNRDRVAKWRNPFYKRGLTYKKLKGRWQWVQRKTRRRRKRSQGYQLRTVNRRRKWIEIKEVKK